MDAPMSMIACPCMHSLSFVVLFVHPKISVVNEGDFASWSVVLHVFDGSLVLATHALLIFRPVEKSTFSTVVSYTRGSPLVPQ